MRDFYLDTIFVPQILAYLYIILYPFLYLFSEIGKECMPPDNSEKAKALSHIERQCRRGSLMRPGVTVAVAEVAVILTDSLALDVALGVGGIP